MLARLVVQLPITSGTCAAQKRRHLQSQTQQLCTRVQGSKYKCKYMYLYIISINVNINVALYKLLYTTAGDAAHRNVVAAAAAAPSAVALAASGPAIAEQAITGCDKPEAAGVDAIAPIPEAECIAGKEGQGSQLLQGCLRLDLSSEEDPLLCTQRMPSTQGALTFALSHNSLCCLVLSFVAVLFRLVLTLCCLALPDLVP